MRSFLKYAFYVLVASVCRAGVPQKMNYQGYLTSSGGTPVAGTKTITFRIYDQPSSGSSLWTETQSGVSIANGLFDVMLGAIVPLSTVSANKWRDTLYLGVTIEGDTELLPRELLVSSAYALSASRVVYDSVVTVALSGGDATNTYQALQSIGSMSPTPSVSTPWLIEYKAGTINEPNALTIPDCVSLKGCGETATVLNFATNMDISLGSYCTVSDLSVLFFGSSGRITIASAQQTRVHNCTFDLDQASPYGLSLQSSSDCVLSGNTVIQRTSGGYTVYLQNAIGLQFDHNVVDTSRVASGSPIAIYAANVTGCVVRDNTIKYDGSNASAYGIKINNNLNSSRVTGNIFLGGVTTPQAQDIFNTTTGAYPVRPTHTGPYGINNQGSGGSALPNF